MIEKIMTAFFLAVSIIYLYLASRFSFGSLESPHAGFLPIIAGTSATLVSAVLFFRALRKPRDNRSYNVDWTKFIFILIGFLIYLITFKFVGYCAASFLFLFYTFKLYYSNVGLLKPALFAGSSVLFFYGLFHYALHVPLP